MSFDLITQSDRLRLVEFTKGEEERSRKQESLRQTEVFNDRIFQYVFEYLRSQFSDKTTFEMPIISSINLSRRIVKEEATIYNDAPDRTFSELEDDQRDVIQMIYKDAMLNQKLSKANESYKLQSQNHLMIVPKAGKLIARSLRNHHVTAIPDPINPEEAWGYVIHSFDKDWLIKDKRFNSEPKGSKASDSMMNHQENADGNNQPIGDPDDYKAALERYVVWTRDMNFIMDGRGSVVSLREDGEPDIESPIPGHLPIIDISGEKDFEYWVRQGETLTEFTVEFNGTMSQISQVVRMQGFAQAILKGPKELLANNITIGPNHILHLPQSPDDGVETSFEFANPGSDIAGSIKFLEVLLSNFLSSRGLDPQLISGSAQAQRFSSGVERLLSMLDKFEATKEDFDLFQRVEDKAYNLIKVWHNTLAGTDKLKDKYQTSEIPEESEVSVQFHRPEMIESQSDKVKRYSEMLEAGFASQKDAVMDIWELDEAGAEEKIVEIEGDFGRTENNEREVEPEVQP